MTSEALLSEFKKIVTEADEGDVSSTEKKNKKRRKKGKTPKAEANIADAAEANVLDTTSKSDVVSKKRAKAEPFFKHTAHVQQSDEQLVKWRTVLYSSLTAVLGNGVAF